MTESLCIFAFCTDSLVMLPSMQSEGLMPCPQDLANAES